MHLCAAAYATAKTECDVPLDNPALNVTALRGDRPNARTNASGPMRCDDLWRTDLCDGSHVARELATCQRQLRKITHLSSIETAAAHYAATCPNPLPTNVDGDNDRTPNPFAAQRTPTDGGGGARANAQVPGQRLASKVLRTRKNRPELYLRFEIAKEASMGGKGIWPDSARARSAEVRRRPQCGPRQRWSQSAAAAAIHAPGTGMPGLSR